MGHWPENRLAALMPMGDLDGKREFRFPDLRGWRVVNTTGHPVGQVEEVFVDPNTLEPGMVLLHYQKFMNGNTRRLLVPWHELRVGDDFVQTRWSEATLLPETARRVPVTRRADALAVPVEVKLTPHPTAIGSAARAGS
jgi:sporulation protein YlmC with PRC-barrel domain